MRISFLGDISLNDNYIDFYKKGIDPFIEVEPLLSSSDFVIGNLESIAKGDFGENFLKKPRIATTVETLNFLKNINLNIACLANNHVYDHLEDGFNKTIEFLNNNKISFLGASFNNELVSNSVIIEKNNIKIGLLNYVTKDTNPNLPNNASVFLNIYDIEKVIQDIQILKSKVNHVVLSLHWGGRVEGGLYPDWDQPKIAYKLIDAGADLIIGHHSHTIQPFEVYKGKYIFYSLGNFCFSDFKFDNRYNQLPIRALNTIIVKIKFYLDKYEVTIDYFRNESTRYKKNSKYKFTHLSRNFIFRYLHRFKLIWIFYFKYKMYVLPILIFLKQNDLSFYEKGKRILKYLYKKGRLFYKV